MLQNVRVLEDAQRTFWERLEEASQDVGLPYQLSDIGRELDIWPSAVQKWRDGVNYPGKANLITLARNRGINVEWLLTGRGPKQAESAMDANTRELLQIWNSLPEEARLRLLNAAHYEKIASDAPNLPQRPLLLPNIPPTPPRKTK